MYKAEELRFEIANELKSGTRVTQGRNKLRQDLVGSFEPQHRGAVADVGGRELVTFKLEPAEPFQELRRRGISGHKATSTPDSFDTSAHASASSNFKRNPRLQGLTESGIVLIAAVGRAWQDHSPKEVLTVWWAQAP
jgi:hypothetical protein